MSFETKKVSDSKIKIDKNVAVNIPAKGSDWIKEPYANIFLLAKKKSGKTTVIKNMLEHFAGKNTKFIFIVSTIDKDRTWTNIVNYWKKKSHDVLTYNDILDDGENVLDEFTKSQNSNEEQIGSGTHTVQQITKTQIPIIDRNNGVRRFQTIIEQKQVGGSVEEKKPKTKVLYPEYIIVLDDLGARMRDGSLTQLLKTNRHYKTKVIMSAQNITDLQPAAIGQLDYTLVFGRVPDDKIERLREQLDLGISEEKFLNLYKDATSQPYQFLYIERMDGVDNYRKGFNEQYNIDDGYR
jgi:hypothetical protein